MNEKHQKQDGAELGRYEMGPLTSAQYYQAMIMASAGFHHSRISIENISGNANVGSDIWGSYDASGRSNRFQPIFLSASVSLVQPFDSAALADAVNDSTVNYSTLSKEIQKVIASRAMTTNDPQRWRGIDKDWSLYELANWIFVYLTGRSMEGHAPDAVTSREYIQGGCPCLEDGSKYIPPFLDLEKVQELEIKITLPKGTLLSDRVVLTAGRGFPYGLTSKDSAPYRVVLRINDIQVPTLIGVNQNERLAKQIVITSVEIDPYITSSCDYYNALEQIIVKSMEESSFETLESLAAHLAKRIIKHFVYQYTPEVHSSRVRIILKKPSAVTFAETPVIEMDWSSDFNVDPRSEKLWSEFKALKNPMKIPFPITGRLDSWIAENFPGDTTGPS